MLKAAATAYLIGLGAVFGTSTLCFAFQIFKLGSQEIWRGGPSGSPPGKVKVLLRKIGCFLFLAAVTLPVAAVWPITLFIVLGITSYQRIREKRQEGKDNAYRR